MLPSGLSRRRPLRRGLVVCRHFDLGDTQVSRRGRGSEGRSDVSAEEKSSEVRGRFHLQVGWWGLGQHPETQGIDSTNARLRACVRHD